jgi:uncharacterized damage-inducible protein DinB
MHDLTGTWEINNRINLYLLEAIDEAHLEDMLSSKGRNVGSQFAHIHNVRLMWLKVAAPQLFAQQTKIEKETGVTKQLLATQLTTSGAAISQLIEQGMEDGKIKGFKPHPSGFAGYMLAHEAHHRSQVIIALKQCGHPVDKKITYGLWEWGSR